MDPVSLDNPKSLSPPFPDPNLHPEPFLPPSDPPPAPLQTQDLPNPSEEDFTKYISNVFEDLQEEKKQDPTDEKPEDSIPDPSVQSSIIMSEPSADDPEAPDSQSEYFQALSSYRVQMTEWTSESVSVYVYSDNGLSQEGLSRVMKEIRVMTKSLPCESGSSIFLNVDAVNMGRMKVLISGPVDTPYEHGLYLFDILLDCNYPNNPPQMMIKTTGDGKLRFNPNLYNNGFVCLSVINTWEGLPEEMWNPSFSSLMQVFLSIQSLVMDCNVLQKEPNYEYYATDSPDNKSYTAIVKFGNLAYAMIDMIKNPPFEFKEVVFRHFYLKKAEIVKTVEKWISELGNVQAGFGNYIVSQHNPITIQLLSTTPPESVFTNLFTELKSLLETLPEPSKT